MPDLHQLIQRAYRTRRSRARTIVEDCLERLPHYSGLPDELVAEIRESILHHLALFYRVTLEVGRPLTPDDLEYSQRLAKQRAAQGVPLGEFLTFFHVGLTVAWDHLIAGADGDPRVRADLLDRVGTVLSNQARLMAALTEAYVEERVRLSRFREQDLDDFVQLLLAEEAPESVIDARARALGIDTEETRALAVFDLPARSEGTSVGPEDLRRWLAASIPAADVWVGRSREGFVASLPVDAPRKALAAAAEALLGERVRVGVGRAGSGVVGLRRSAHEALRALRIGGALGGPQRVRRFADVAVLDLVGVGGDPSRAEAFARRVLGPLVEPGVSPAYLETLAQLSACNYHIKVAAAELDVHPHTLSYRVKQLRDRFGYDLEDPDLRLRVRLALLIREAHGCG